MKKGRFLGIISKLLRREVFRDWAQSLAIVAIGAITVTLFVGLQANASSLEQRRDELVSVSSPADIYVTTDPHSLSSDNDSKAIASLLDPGDYLESRFYGYCAVEGHRSMLAVSPFYPNLSKGYDLTLSDSSSDVDYFLLDEAVVRDIRSSNPDYTPLDAEAKISFDVSSLKLDELTLTVLDALTIEGQENPFRKGTLPLTTTITGTMKHPENTTKTSPIPFLAMMSNKRFKAMIVSCLESSFTSTGVQLIMRQGFYQRLGWGDGTIDGGTLTFPSPNQYLVHLKDKGTAHDKKKAIGQLYENKIENNLYLLQTLEETAFMSTLEGEITQARQLNYVFPIVFFVVAVLVILTTLRQNILRRRSEIGTMKAIGVSKLQIHGHFLSQTGLLVLLSSLIGCITGPFIIPIIMAKKYDLLYTLPPRTYLFPWASGAIAIGAFLLVALLATFLITRKEIALKPVDSLRPKAMKIHRRILRSSQKPQKRLALAAKIAGRNIVYDPLKAVMVVIGMMGCTALLICGFGIDDTLDYGLKTDPYVQNGSDAMAHFRSGKTQQELDADLRELRDEEETLTISSYQPYERIETDLVHEGTSYSSAVFVLGKNYSFDGALPPTHFTEEFPKDKVLMSTKVAESLRVTIGDTVTFHLNRQYVTAPIHSIYDAFYGNGIVIYADSPLFTEAYPGFSSCWVNAREGVAEESLATSLKNLPYVLLVDTHSEWTGRVKGIVSSISTMTNAVKVFAILLALTVIYNLGLLNIRERAREIATLKVLGFTMAEIGATLLFETLSMTLLGILAGLALGFPFMQLVLIINEIQIIDYIYMIYPLTYVFASLGSFLAATGVNALLTHRIRLIHPVESLKSVE
ncbi:MAG: FtsX-like permease family protein [Bacilli bacterium]|nr:FtsX-like permease family protein [Bacilli bacterium]